VYAAADVTALHALKAVLLEEAEAKGLMPFVREEQAALSTTIYVPEHKDFFLKAGDQRHLSPHAQHVLNGLFQFRDELARKLNRPAFQVMDEGLLRDVFAGDISTAQAPFERGVFGGFRNERFGRQLADRLDTLRREADEQGLSKARPPREHDTDHHRDKAELAAKREQIFTPIQQELASRFGEHAARFILSNGTVTEVLRGNMKLSQMKRDYKRKLITSIASSRGISLEDFL
jgi:ribonuclease D